MLFSDLLAGMPVSKMQGATRAMWRIHVRWPSSVNLAKSFLITYSSTNRKRTPHDCIASAVASSRRAGRLYGCLHFLWCISKSRLFF